MTYFVSRDFEVINHESLIMTHNPFISNAQHAVIQWDHLIAIVLLDGNIIPMNKPGMKIDNRSPLMNIDISGALLTSQT